MENKRSENTSLRNKDAKKVSNAIQREGPKVPQSQKGASDPLSSHATFNNNKYLFRKLDIPNSRRILISSSFGHVHKQINSFSISNILRRHFSISLSSHISIRRIKRFPAKVERFHSVCDFFFCSLNCFRTSFLFLNSSFDSIFF